MCGGDVKKVGKEVSRVYKQTEDVVKEAYGDVEDETKRVVQQVGDEASRVYKKVEDETKRIYKDAEDLFQTAVGDKPGPAPAGVITTKAAKPAEEPVKKKKTAEKPGIGLTILGGARKGLLAQQPGTKKKLYT